MRLYEKLTGICCMLPVVCLAMLVCVFPAYAESDSEPEPVPDCLVINEVCTSNYKSAPQNNGKYCDWVELFNSSDTETIRLSDYYITDSKKVTPDNPGDKDKLFKLPGIDLYPHQYTVIWFSDDMEDIFHTGFGLDSEKDNVYLYHGETLVDYVEPREIPVNCSYGRDNDFGGFVYF